MDFPPRLSHLATRAVIVSKLVPSYALAHRVDDDEAASRLDTALRGALLDDLLDATWAALQLGGRKPVETLLLEKIAASLADRPLRPGKAIASSAAMSAFWILIDLEAGTASDAARRLMETDAGRTHGKAGLKEAGAFLAGELTRKP